MLRADRRVVVSHVGSLVRPPAMIPYLEKIRDKEPYDEAAFEKCLTDSVAEAVRLQADWADQFREMFRCRLGCEYRNGIQADIRDPSRRQASSDNHRITGVERASIG